MIFLRKTFFFLFLCLHDHIFSLLEVGTAKFSFTDEKKKLFSCHVFFLFLYLFSVFFSRQSGRICSSIVLTLRRQTSDLKENNESDVKGGRFRDRIISDTFFSWLHVFLFSSSFFFIFCVETMTCRWVAAVYCVVIKEQLSSARRH